MTASARWSPTPRSTRAGRRALAAAPRAGAPGVPPAQRPRSRCWTGSTALVDGSIDAASARHRPCRPSPRWSPSCCWPSALAWLLSRARRTARAARGRGGRCSPTTTITADELRARAERALAEGRNADAVVDGFRALTVRQVERGRLDDLPGATAHEVARRPRRGVPRQAPTGSTGSAALFDAVLYGDRPATPTRRPRSSQLDDALVGRR